jgi:PAS domain S-box-containing protein
MMASFIDITERKQVEEKIKIFSDAVTGALDCFLLVDTNGKITYVNTSACITFGYTPEEFLKLNVIDLDADPEVAKKVMRELAVKGRWNGEVMNIRKNKEKFPSLLSAFIIKDEKGKQKGMMGILRDITERKQAEEDIKKKTEELEKSKKELEEKLKELERFSRLSVGRELRMIELKKRVKELESELDTLHKKTNQ